MNKKLFLMMIIVVEITLLIYLFFLKEYIIDMIVFIFILCINFYLVLSFFKISIININKIKNKNKSKKIRKSIDINEEYMRTLNISTFDGSGSITHPSLLFFPQGYAGFSYWMAFTPYDNNNVEIENPCILVSNDGTNFVEHPNITNPLLPIIKKTKPNTYYSDPFLFYNDNKIELWYRHTVESENLDDSIFRIIIDESGKVSDSELMINDNNQYLSLSIIKVYDKYIMYSFNTNNQLQICESTDLKKWSKIKYVSNNQIDFWHGEVRLNAGKIFLLIMSKNYKLYSFFTDVNNYDLVDQNFNEIKFSFYDNSKIYGDSHLYKSSILFVDDYILYYVPYRIKKLEWLNKKIRTHKKWILKYSKLKEKNVSIIYK